MRLRSTWLVLMLGILVGLGLAMGVTAGRMGGVPWVRSGPATAAPAPGWGPQIAYQYYSTEELDPQFLAEHVDWLMLRYGAERLRDSVREQGYSNVLPQYLLLFQIIGPGPYEGGDEHCDDDYTPLQNNVLWTGDFCEQVHPNEDWFLHNEHGERLYTEERLWNGSHAAQYYMNPGSPGFREFWVDQVRRQRDAGWEAIFLDNVAATYSHIGQRADNGEGVVAEYESVEAWQEAVAGMLAAIKAAFPERPLWGNIIEAPARADAWDYYRPLLDGVQEESFATGWASDEPLGPGAWEAMLARAERTLAAGKGVVLYSQGEQNDYARLRFGLASYLLVATPDARATFRYAHTSSYEHLWWYPEFDITLGGPLGPRYRTWGGRWARDFACGRVEVDAVRRTGAITTQACIE